MNGQHPLLSVVIPTYRGREHLVAVLAALARQSLDGAAFEVIVSIDGRGDGTAAILAARQVPYALRWVEGERAGPGFARNRGARLARGGLLLFLDDDIVATPALLAAHLDAHRAAGEQTVCLGQVRLPPAYPLSAGERYLAARLEEHYDKMNRPGYRPDFWDCLSGNFSLRRDLWQASGGFAPAFAAGRHEDIELGYRLQHLGARFLYERAALAHHRYRKDPAAGLRDARTEGHSACRLARAYPELAPALFDARWQRYPPPFQAVLRRAGANPGQLRRLAWTAARLVIACQRMPLSATRPLYRAAFHLHFWLGAQEEGCAAGR